MFFPVSIATLNRGDVDTGLSEFRKVSTLLSCYPLFSFWTIPFFLPWGIVMKCLISFFVMLSIIISLSSEVSAGKSTRERDTDNDGQTDQIACFDETGRIERLEIDSNADGVMDRFQYFEDQQIVRIEADTDHDRKIDCREYLKAGKRIRQELLSNDSGRVVQVSEFDSVGRIVEIRKNTTEDDLFDSIYSYKDGKLFLFAQDTDGDGKPNISQTYNDDKPVYRSIDDNGDGQMDVFCIYRDGVLFERKTDMDHDGVFEIIIRFKDGRPVEEEKDTNRDGKTDMFTWFDSNGNAEKIEEDTRHTGRIDRIRTYYMGWPVNVVSDIDGDGFKETITLFKNGKIRRQTEDRNQDGKPDITTWFDEKGKKERIESDTNLNGKIDTWQYYEADRLTRMEKDEKGNGSINLKVFYSNGKKCRVIMDRDNDGLFEITQRFDESPWSMVMELDADGDKHPEARYCYEKGVLRLKEIDKDRDGNPDLMHHYNAEGKLTKTREMRKGVDGPGIIWFYDDREEAIRAEQDRTGDGHVDIWYHYRKGKLTGLDEDTNADGKPDIWEIYDESQTLLKISFDLDFDGKPDSEENGRGKK
jgi:antitoxin component YwqK of YwqJK toxin-antitoxin module